MKSRLQAVSTLLLIAMVLSFIPAAAMPSSASAAQYCTDRAQFLADVTVPDGTRFDPGAAFTKTWRLKNVGTCTWSTSYSAVFDSGTQMGSTTSSAFANSVAPGQNIEVTVNMTAPNTAGDYIGYWKFKNASGATFGIGPNANKSWWVAITVTGSTQTGVAYDFTANAGSATWSSGAGGLSFPSTNGDPKGFALKYDHPSFESGVTSSQPGMLFSPQQITNGFIQAVYPDFTVQAGDRFQTTVGCEFNATSCYVAYRLDYQVGTTIRTFWSFREKYEGWTYDANLDLSPLAGQTVKFILFVSAFGSPVGDYALWGYPVIMRKGVVSTPTPTGTPPTPTATSTPAPITPTVPPSSCDRAQFIGDVNFPDGSSVAPGATFTKTWRIKNIGYCPWTTSYQLVFFSGERMNGPTTLTFSKNVAVGETYDFSVNLTAPTTAGSYRGYWMFKNASGVSFGIGPDGNKPWWVDIKVSGSTVTPGGPTYTPTPTGTAATPGAGIAYDFATNACSATWYSRAGQLTCPGTDGDTTKGFVLKVSNPKLENGATDPRPGIITFPSPPQGYQDGYIQGFYPPFQVQKGDRFRSVINCEAGATLCYVAFRLDYEVGGTIHNFAGAWGERYEKQFNTLDVDLSSLAGQNVKFILTVLSAGVNTGDRALWVGPIIYRASGTTPSSGTMTPTSTSTPSSTTATATATATPTKTGAPAYTATSTATPTSTATAGSTSNLYQNTTYNFKFALPAGATIVNQSDTAGYVNVPLLQTGTNLLEKYIQVNVAPGATSCTAPNNEGGGTPENVTINGIQFTKQSGQGAAAGNRYDWTSYSTMYNNACINLTFVLHSANQGNFSPTPPAFDPTAESAFIGTTMATFNKINQ